VASLGGGIAWRFAVLGGATAGLALSPALSEASPGLARPMVALGLAAGLGLFATRPVDGRVAQGGWLALLSLAAAATGLAVGVLRLAAIDDGAFRGPAGRSTTARGFVTAVPRRSQGRVRVRVQTADGRLAIESPEPVGDLPIGHEVSATGTLRDPEPWEAGYLARYGIRQVLAADRLRLTGRRRGGPLALIDRIRDRAEAALESGTPEAEAALLRGFVLGEDDSIEEATVDDFKRSGLAHLLAVSGENVILLALLAVPMLALLGIPVRARLLCVLALIAIYVPVTGAGPSIQRAGVMGAAGIVAALAGRPRSRWYAILLAAFVTLAISPRASGDVGWRLSFAAVIGIVLWAGPLRDSLLGSSVHGGGPGRTAGWRRPLAEGAGVTIAATLSTAPLMAHDFGTVSLASLPANLLALPAVAPVMWLGMLASLAGQLPWLPVEPLTGLAGVLAAYVAQVAHWLGSPGWATASVSLAAPASVLIAYAVLALALWVLLGWARRRRALRGSRARLKPLLLTTCLVASSLALAGPGRSGGVDAGPAAGLRVVVLDVGQGDAILLDPADGAPVLVDGGPAGAGFRGMLEDEGVADLAAAIITHDQWDHSGGIRELIGAFPVRRLLYPEPSRDLIGDARSAGVRAMAIAEGSEVDSGSLRIEVLWPPRPLLEGSPLDDPNQTSLVLLARWRRFEMLLTADAEAESVPIDPGPVDVLKVAHHGSEDAGLDRLLDRSAPRVAVISVGEDNPYGHPSATTLTTLAEHEIPALRTDEQGAVTILVSRRGWEIETRD
jgi:competence protein ComEC